MAPSIPGVCITQEPTARTHDEETGATLWDAQDALSHALTTARMFVNRYEKSVLTPKNVTPLLVCYEEFANKLNVLKKECDERPWPPSPALDAFSHHAESITDCFRTAVVALRCILSTAEEKSALGRRIGTASLAPVCTRLLNDLREANNHIAAIEAWLSNMTIEDILNDGGLKGHCLSPDDEVMASSESPVDSHDCGLARQISARTNGMLKGVSRSTPVIRRGHCLGPDDEVQASLISPGHPHKPGFVGPVSADTNDTLKRVSRSMPEIGRRDRPAAIAENREDLFRATFFVPKNPPNVAINFDSMDSTGAPSTAEGKAKAALLNLSPDARKVVAIVGPTGSGKSCILRGLGHHEDVRRRFVDGCYHLALHMDADRETIFGILCHLVRLSGGELTAKSMEKKCELEGVLEEAKRWFRDRACLFLVENVWTQNRLEMGFVPRILSLVAASSDCALVFTTQDSSITVPRLAINIIQVNNASVPARVHGTEFLEAAIKNRSEELKQLQEHLNELQKDRTSVLLQLRKTRSVGGRFQSALIQRLGFLNFKTKDVLSQLEQSFEERCHAGEKLDDLLITKYSQQIHEAISCFIRYLDDYRHGDHDGPLCTEFAKVNTVVVQCIGRMEEHVRELLVERQTLRCRSSKEGGKKVEFRHHSVCHHLVRRVNRIENSMVAFYGDLDALEDRSFRAWEQITIQEFESFARDVSPNILSRFYDETTDPRSEQRVEQKLQMKRRAIIRHMTTFKRLRTTVRETCYQDASACLLVARLRREHARITLERSHFELLEEFLMSQKSLVQRTYLNHIRQSPRVDTKLLMSVLKSAQSFSFRDIVLAHKLAVYQMKRNQDFRSFFESTDAARSFFLESLYGRLVDIPLSEGQILFISRMLQHARNLDMLSVDGATSLGLVLRLKRNVEEKIQDLTEVVADIYTECSGRLTVLELQLSSIETALYRLKESRRKGKRVAVWAALVKLGLSLIPIAGQIAGAAVDLASQGVEIMTDTVLNETSVELLQSVAEILTTTGEHAVDLFWSENDPHITSCAQRENLAAANLGRLMLSVRFRDKMPLRYREKLVKTIESAWGAHIDEVERDIELILISFRDVEDPVQFEVDDDDLYGRDIFFEEDYVTNFGSFARGALLGAQSHPRDGCPRCSWKDLLEPDSAEERTTTTATEKEVEAKCLADEEFQAVDDIADSKIDELPKEDQIDEFALRCFRSTVSEIYGKCGRALCHDEAVVVLKDMFPNDELDWLPPFFAEGALLDTDSNGTYRVSEQQFSVAVRQVLGAVNEARDWHYSTLWAERFIEATPSTTGVANVALVCRLIRDVKTTVPGENHLHRIVTGHVKGGTVSLAQFSAIVDSLSTSKTAVS